jgi:hypothetical protein
MRAKTKKFKETSNTMGTAEAYNLTWEGNRGFEASQETKRKQAIF